MTQDKGQVPEALRLAAELDETPDFAVDPNMVDDLAAELRRQHARIAELEAQLESIGAGGVSGPLMVRAADHFPDVTKMASRWYVLNKDGMATLCADKADAEQEAIDAQAAWPGVGPHRAVQLVEAGASLPLPGAQEAVAWAMFADNGNIRLWSKKPIPHPDAIPLYAAPQPALSAGWVSLSGALPKPGTPVLLDIGNKYPIRAQWVPKDSLEATGDGDFGEYNEASDMASAAAGGYRDGWTAAQAISAEPAVHVQNPAENEHVAGDVSKNGAEANMRGAAYAPMPRAAYIEFDGQEETAWHTPDQMRAFADRTHALRMEQAAPKAARAA